MDKNNIPVPKCTSKKDGCSSSDNKERCYDLVVGSSDSSSFIIDSGASRHTASVKELFISMYYDSGPTVRMGDDSKIQAKGIGKIDLEDG